MINPCTCGATGTHVGVRGDWGAWYVRCLECDVKGSVQATPEEAVKAWNGLLRSPKYDDPRAANWWGLEPAPGLNWALKHKPEFVVGADGKVWIKIHPEDAHLFDPSDFGEGPDKP